MEIGAVITCKHNTNTQYVKKHIDPSVQSELSVSSRIALQRFSVDLLKYLTNVKQWNHSVIIW